MAVNTPAAKVNKKKNDGTMTITEHLGELRKVIVTIVMTFLLATVVCYYFAGKFVQMCLDLAPEQYKFVITGPAELMGQYVKVSIIVGLVCAIPVAIWQIYRFASPGLKKNESRTFLSVMLSGVLFFAIGAVFCYLVVIPFMLQFFLSLNTIEVEGMYSVKEYMNYLVGVITAFGIIFEIPVLASLLALIGILKPDIMVKGRRLVIVINFIIGAAITPTDVVSQLLVAIPMCILYEVAILLVKIISRARAKRNPEDVEEEEERQEEMREERRSRWEKAAAEADRQAEAKKKEKEQKK